MPSSTGRSISKRFCLMRLPTGSVIPTLSPTRRVAQVMMIGMVKRVITLLRAVSVTDSATSPSASLENTLEELPPGQHAMSTRPMKNTGGRRKRYARPSAIAGRRTSWPNSATAMGQGLRKTFAKSSNLRASPRSNIRSVRMGRTIQIVFIIVKIQLFSYL